MTKQEYATQRLDPRWQKKRLEIMQRDGFKCRACESSDKTLSVHHAYYVTGRKPWEYPCFSLRTLCDGCHKDEHSPKSEPDEIHTPLTEWEDQIDWIFGGDIDLAWTHWPLAVEIQKAADHGIDRRWLFEYLAECTKAYVMKEMAVRP